MIKCFFLLLFLFFVNQSFGQKSDYDFSMDKIAVKDGLVSYTLIDTIPSNDLSKIHSKILEWLSMNFKSSKKVIDLDDKNENKIIAKGFSNEEYSYKLVATNNIYKYEQYFTLNFSLKNNKYRLVISYFRAKGIVSPLTFMIKQDLSVEEYLAYVPKTYDFEKMTRKERFALYISKQILENSCNFSNEIFKSLKSFMKTSEDF